MKRLLCTTAIVCGALWFHPPTAHAGKMPPPEPKCSTSDITVTIAGVPSSPVACASDVQSGPSNAATETTLLNTTFGTNFSLIGRMESNGAASVATLDGIKFTMSTNSIMTGPTGSFALSWVDTNGTTLDNLPIDIDFDVLIFGGNNADAYKFSKVLLPDAPNNSGTASFTIVFFNNGGQVPDLSHITVTAGDDVEVNQTVVSTPEPSTIALLGLGLLGTLAVAKRKRG
jgi:PEP-CTERM motif